MPTHYLNPGAREPRAPRPCHLHRLNPDAADAGAPPAPPGRQHAELLRAGALTVAMWVLGAALGPLWAAISPPGPRAVVWNEKHQLVIDETEAFIATDVRFAIIVAIVGLAAGLFAWLHRPLRGPLGALALAAGGVGGAYLTSIVGHYVRGGTDVAKPVGTLIEHAPLAVHIAGLFYLEGALALLVFLLFVAFSAHDDLGRAEPAPA